MNTNILIAGGYGVVGRQIARLLRASGHRGTLLLGGRNPVQGTALAHELGEAQAVELDLQAPERTLQAHGPVGLIISALHDPADALVEAALTAGAAHIGITWTANEIAPVSFLLRQRLASRPVVLLGHWQAGVLTHAARHATRRFKRVDGIRLAALFDPRDPIGPLSAQDSENFTGRALLRQGRRWQWVDSHAHRREIDLGDGGTLHALPVAVLDVQSLAALTGAADVRFDVGLGESQGTQRGAAATHDLYIDITGELHDGTTATKRTRVSGPQGQAHLTAVGVAIAAERVLGLDGASPAAGGLQLPETLIATETAVARLAAHGVQVDEEA